MRPTANQTSTFRKLEASDKNVYIYRFVNLLILVIVMFLILSDHIALARIGWLLGAVMLVAYSYIFRDTLKKYLGLSDSINVGNKYYEEHKGYYEKIKSIKDNFTDLSSVASITESELIAYQHEVEKMKKLSDAIMDPNERDNLEINTEILRDKATNVFNTNRKYISALGSVSKNKTDLFMLDI